MKEKDKNFIMNTFSLDEKKFTEMVSRVKTLLAEGEDSRDNYIKELTANLPGRDAYEVKKILTHRLD